MEPVTLAILAVTAFASAVLSAVVGMAGGAVLLAVMLWFYDPLVAIPLHGVVQLVSNASRSVAQARHVRWGIVARYGILLLPAGFAGFGVLNALPPDVARVIIGLFVLVATWRPGWLLVGSRRPQHASEGLRFVLLGGVVGVLNTSVGAVGPLIAPFFLGIGLDRRALVGTKAACQMLGHLAKLAVFGVLGFAFQAYAAPLAVLAAAVVLGTSLGSLILGRVSETAFVRLYMSVLTIVALRLVVWDGLAALGWR